jgi:beta-glucosidase-like glycosyl hydrolase
MGKAVVYGLQGNDPKYLKIYSCAKHYAVHKFIKKKKKKRKKFFYHNGC